MARLFLTVWPPEEVVEELVALRRKDQRGVRFVHPERWHITLRFFGEANPDDVIAALEGPPYEAANARLGPAVDIQFDKALVVPVKGVDLLAADVTRRTRHIGQAPRKRFDGHLTLARVKPYAEMPPALGALVSAEFDVHEFALVQSRLHPDGARYETLETWPVG